MNKKIHNMTADELINAFAKICYNDWGEEVPCNFNDNDEYIGDTGYCEEHCKAFGECSEEDILDCWKAYIIARLNDIMEAEIMEIENRKPRDMIELPYKINVFNLSDNVTWQVVYRTKIGMIKSMWFYNEAEADRFIERLNDIKNNDIKNGEC